MADQRLPTVNGDDGVWGDILRNYLLKEHYNGDANYTVGTSTNGGHQFVTIRPGTSSAAPLTFTAGTNLGTAAAGSVEYDGTYYYLTTSSAIRRQIVMDTATQTLTNKTLTSPAISAPTFSGSYSFGGTPTWPTFNQNTTGSAATLTTSRNFQTNLASTSAAGFNGSADNTHGVTGTLPVANGGTGRATSTTPYGLIAAGTGATTAQQTIAPGTAGQFLKSAGASALASFAGITQADVANLTTDLAAKAADNAVVKLTGNQTVAGDKTFSDVVTLNDITYAKEINITPTNGTPQSAAFTLDNDNGQVWQFTNNSGGNFAFWDQTNSKAPFSVQPNAPDQSFVISNGSNYSGQDLTLDNNRLEDFRLYNGVIETHPESDGLVVFPHMVNDIAYNTRLGGSTIWKKNGVVTLPDYGDDNIFLPDATMASYLGLSNPATDTITIEVTLHRAFNWGVKWGIVMTPWCCALNVQLEVWDNIAGSWATAYTKTNDDSGMHWVSYSAPTGHDMTKIRWTLTNFNSPDPRITQIAAIQFNSSLLSGPFATRSGGDIYGTYRFWPDVAGQSASIALDNRVNQSWLHATNSSGQLTMYDETNDKTPFLINRNTPTGALTLDTTEIHAQLPINMHAQKITGVTNPTSAQDAATKAYVDSAAANMPKYDGNLIIGGNFQNDANWANAWGTQTTAQAVHTGEKSHQIVSTGAGAGTDYLSLTHDGTGTPALMPAVAERRYVIQIWLRKKSTNVGGGNVIFQTVRTRFDNSITTIASSYSASTDISNSQWLYFETTHTVSGGDDKYHQFRVAIDSGVPAGDTFYIGGVIVSDLTGGFTTYTDDLLTNKTVEDDSFTIQNASDNTKTVQFSLSGLTTGTAITLNAPSVASGSHTIVTRNSTDTLLNKRVNPRTIAPSVAASYAINTDTTDFYTVTAQNQDFTFSNPSGTPVDGQKLMIRVKDNGTARNISWGTNFQNSGIASLLYATVANREHNILFVYSTGVSKWVCLATDAVGY